MIPLLRDKCLNISSHSPIWHYTFQWTLTHAPLAHWAIIGCHLVSPVVAPAYLEQCMHGLVNHRMSDKPNFFDGKASLAAKFGVPKKCPAGHLGWGCRGKILIGEMPGCPGFQYSFLFIYIHMYIHIYSITTTMTVISCPIIANTPTGAKMQERIRQRTWSETTTRSWDPWDPGAIAF